MNRFFSIRKIPFIRSLLRDKPFQIKTVANNLSFKRFHLTFIPDYTKPTSIIKATESTPTSMYVEFQDGIRGDLNYIWLRDNCQCKSCYDSDRKLKMLDTVALQRWVRPEYIASENQDLKIVWLENPQHISLYPPAWLHKYVLSFYSYRHMQVHDVLPPVVTWNNGKLAERNLYHQYDEFMSCEGSVDKLIKDLYTLGIACVVGTPCNEDEVLKIVNRFNSCSNSPKTFRFDVPETPVLKQRLCVGNMEFHNGMNYRKLHPGLQAVHCLRVFNNNFQRKDFVDGFAIAKWMKYAYPEEYVTLSTVPVKFKYTLPGLEYVNLHTVIRPDKVDGLSEVHYNNQTMAPFEGPVDHVADFYNGYRRFGKKLRSEEYQYNVEMRPGDVVIYNNRRILHRWSDFEPSLSGHFAGCYGDFELLVAQLRHILKKKLVI